MVVNPIPKNNVLSQLWIGTANIYEYQEVTNPINHQTTLEPVIVIENEPCRLSYSTEQVTDLQSGIATIQQVIKLFIRSDILINAGSIIEITQHGKTNKYKRAGEPSIYTNHQEIVLEIDKDV